MKKVVFVLDGLDELLSRDATFAEDIPLGLELDAYYVGLLWSS